MEENDGPGRQGSEQERHGGRGRVFDREVRRDQVRIQREPATDEHENDLEDRTEPGKGVSPEKKADQRDQGRSPGGEPDRQSPGALPPPS